MAKRLALYFPHHLQKKSRTVYGLLMPGNHPLLHQKHKLQMMPKPLEHYRGEDIFKSSFPEKRVQPEQLTN
ncbi:UNVERIFIED_CONTAM: hypothetical protein Sradi_1221500 [Sesamum radiatum]|uniref:Uncharacterized protein n=1 Tax=Sesamum radiatum TaxID=300843 RepID=A0AAW2UPC2_SESRA